MSPPSAQSPDRWIPLYRQVEARAKLAYIAAVMADAFDSPDAEAAWDRWRMLLVQSFTLAGMAGVARGYGEARRAGLRIEASPSLVDAPPAPVGFAAVMPSPDPIRAGPFVAAIDRFRKRVPRLASEVRAMHRAAEAASRKLVTAERRSIATGLLQRLRQVRRELDRAFTVAGATIEQVGSVMDVVLRSMQDAGRPVEDREFPVYSSVLQQVQAAAGVTADRADTVMRTNVLRVYNDTHAATLGRGPVKAVLPLVMLVEIHDRRTRGAPDGVYAADGRRNPGHHWQMDGYIATIEAMRSQGLIPPNGYRCRGSIRGVSLAELEELGIWSEDGGMDLDALRAYNGPRQRLIDEGLYPDPGFRK